MREGYKKLTKSLREDLKMFFNKSEEYKRYIPTIEQILRVELMLTGFYLATYSSRAREAWSIIPGYDVFKFSDLQAEGVAVRLRILFGFYRAESRWITDLEDYKQIPSDFRLYDIDNSDEFTEIPVRYIRDRKETYLGILQCPIPYKCKVKDLSLPGEFTYERFEGADRIPFKGLLPTIEVEKRTFPHYRTKPALSFTYPDDWKSVKIELKQTNPEGNWDRRMDSMQIVSKKQNMVLNYSGLTHIVGGLGTGKTNFRVIETYRLVKNFKAKVGLIEGSVAEVNKRVSELQALGIKAVPIIGKSSKGGHLKNYLLGASNKIDTISDWLEDTHSTVKHLTGQCYLKALTLDYDRDYLPCNSLMQEGNEVQCSLAHCCGTYEDMRNLLEADVWITTTAAVMKSTIPSVLDPYQRRIFMAMYDLLDVIFIDEADQVQEVFDETFIEEHDLFGSPQHLLEELERELSLKVSGRYSKLASNPLVISFRSHVASLSNVIWEVYRLLDQSPRLHKHLASKKLFHIYVLAHELTEKLSATPTDSDKVWRSLRNYISDPTSSDLLSKTTDELIDPEKKASKSDLIDKCITGITKKLAPNVHKELLNLQLEFFLYLGRFEYHLKNIIQYAEIVNQELDIKAILGKMYSLRKDYAAFLKDGMTGMLVGYRYIPKENRLGEFKFFEYSGVGRLLLEEWHKVYHAADNLKGPGIVLLSGTSYAPTSRHHHILTPVDFLIRAANIPGKIEQFYHPFYDQQTGKPVYISGIPDKGERGRSLRQVTELLKPLLEQELDHWKKENRRVLLVVNSYEDLEHVAEVLAKDSRWQERFKVVTRGESQEQEPYTFPLVNIDQFRLDSAEILIAPLLSMNRGHNILDAEGKALFGSVFFLIRPYPVPDDLSYIIKALHAQLPGMLLDIKSKSLTGSAAIKELRKTSIRKLEAMVRKPDYWRILNPNERDALSWFIMIPIWQMIGRLLRGNRDARVFYIDAKFGMEIDSNKGKIPSLIAHWQKMFKQMKKDEVIQALYGPFSSSLPEL